MTTPTLLNDALQHHQAGRFAAAAALYRELLSTDPEHVDALHLLGLALYQQGQIAAGAEFVEQAIRRRPEFPEAHFNLANMLRDGGDRERAEATFRRALELKPGYAEAHFNLGNLLRDQGNAVGAAAEYEAAIRARPNYVKALMNLGQLYLEHQQPQQALAHFEAVLRLQPRSAAALSNLSVARRRLGELPQAVAAAQRALEIDPRFGEAANNLGAAMLEQGDTAGALHWFEQAISWRADHARARLNRGIAWLKLGDFERGWDEYEWRWRCPEYSLRYADRPLWDGTPLDGRTVLLHAEQGFGDVIQFVRYAPLVAARGGRVIVECDRRLHRLLSSCRGIDQWSDRDASPPPFDVHLPLLSVPRVLRTTLSTIPADVPYVWAEPQRVAQWSSALDARARRRIGIQWRGNPLYPAERYRRLPLALFERLARVSGTVLYSLQKDGLVAEAPSMFPEGTLMDLAPRLDLEGHAFRDTAAVIANLDLVISCDTSIAHLAGALGRPVWLALPFNSEWRWLKDRSDTPWYPTMRLFRQMRFGQWDDVFDRMTAALAELSVER